MGRECFACLFVTAMHSLKNQHPQLPHRWGRDGRYAVPPFEKDAGAAIQGDLLGLRKSKTSSSPWKFSLLFLVVLAASVVWPLHDKKGWRGDMILLKDFRAREYSRPGLMPAGSGSLRHQGSSGGHIVLALATPSQSSSTWHDFYSYNMKVMTLVLLLQDTRSSADEKQHTRASLTYWRAQCKLWSCSGLSTSIPLPMKEEQ